MITITKEKTYAKELLTDGWIDKKRGMAVYILSKYYRFVENLSKTETKKKIEEFCIKNIKDYKLTSFYKNVNMAVNRAYRDNAFMVEIDNITVYQSEIDYINNLEIENDLKKMLFSMLCIVKLTRLYENRDEKNCYTTEDKGCRYLKRVSNYKSKEKIFVKLHELYRLGLIRSIDSKQVFEVLFMKNIEYKEDDKVYLIDNFEQFGLWWDKYGAYNSNIIQCCKCGNLLIRKSNRQLMCKDCSEDANRLYNTLKHREYRDKD